MRNSAVVVATAVLVSLLGVSQGRYFEEPSEVAPFSLIDPIIKAILEAMRPKLANIKIDDIDQKIQNPSLNATIRANDILVRNLDKFVIKTLKSNVLPMKLANLTLTWDDIAASAAYDVDASVAIGKHGPFNLFGKGKAKSPHSHRKHRQGVDLKGIYFTIGANIEMKDKAIQVKPKGFFGFDLNIRKVNVTLTSLMGSSELGNAVGVFFSKIIPDLVDALKKPVFDAFHDNIVKFVNQILKKNGTSYFLDEEPTFPFDALDLSEEVDTSFFNQPLDLSSEEVEYDF